MALPASVILKASLCSCSQGFLQLRGGLSLLHGQSMYCFHSFTCSCQDRSRDTRGVLSVYSRWSVMAG